MSARNSGFRCVTGEAWRRLASAGGRRGVPRAADPHSVRQAAASEHEFVAGALERGYAVVVSDVRGRYSSEGDFDPYSHEGLDGYDTIEWVAAQPWSNGRVATAGLSYPGAVQWLAAVEAPPHLVCAFPAMCFSSARQFFYFGGAFDMSWLPWTAKNIAPEDGGGAESRPGRKPAAKRAQWWREHGRDALRRVPLRDQPAARRHRAVLLRVARSSR